MTSIDEYDSMSKYYDMAMRTSGGFPVEGRHFSQDELQLLCGSLGLAGESGEFADDVKKLFFHLKPVSDDKLMTELGDVLWYVALICKAKGWSIGQVASRNVDKLEKRYPNGFTYAAANAERKVEQ
jgi:NTP pyrophosphatase (non-canonical NTP hydrolase)